MPRRLVAAHGDQRALRRLHALEATVALLLRARERRGGEQRAEHVRDLPDHALPRVRRQLARREVDGEERADQAHLAVGGMWWAMRAMRAT